jgi:type II secretory pathway component PulF
VTYRYRAATADGRVSEGLLDAPSREGALAELRRRQLVPVDLAETDAAPDAAAAARRATLRRPAATAVAVRTLATLLGAGVPLDRALGFAGEQAGHPDVAAALAAVRRDVRGGATLGDAMRGHPAVFGSLHVAMLAAGEAGGALAGAAARLADHLDEAAELRAQLRSALLYPAVMAVVAGAGVTTLLLFVVPRFVAMLDVAGGALPLSTRVLVATSGLVAGLWWLWAALAVGVVLGARAWLARPENRFRWHRRRLALPVAGRIERAVATARFARTLGLLLDGGTRLLPALRIAGSTSPNLAFADDVARAAAEVGQGRRLADALARVLPPLALQLLAAGEESGRLAPLALKAADAFDAEVRRTLRSAVGLVEPLLIVVFGAVVGFVALAMLQAIYSINVSGL